MLTEILRGALTVKLGSIFRQAIGGMNSEIGKVEQILACRMPSILLGVIYDCLKTPGRIFERRRPFVDHAFTQRNSRDQVRRDSCPRRILVVTNTFKSLASGLPIAGIEIRDRDLI